MAVFQDESSGTDTADTVVVRVSRAGGDLKAVAVEILSVSHTDTGLKSAVVSLILHAVRDEVRNDTLAVDVADVSKNALTANSIVGTVGGTELAAASDQEVSRLAFTLSVAKNCIESTVFI